MTRKAKPAAQKKVKPNLNRPEARPVINLGYLKVYNEVLKFEEVQDIDLDTIHSVILGTFVDEVNERKLSPEPDQFEIETLVEKIVDKLVLLQDQSSVHHESQNEKFLGLIAEMR